MHRYSLYLQFYHCLKECWMATECYILCQRLRQFYRVCQLDLGKTYPYRNDGCLCTRLKGHRKICLLYPRRHAHPSQKSLLSWHQTLFKPLLPRLQRYCKNKTHQLMRHEHDDLAVAQLQKRNLLDCCTLLWQLQLLSQLLREQPKPYTYFSKCR